MVECCLTLLGVTASLHTPHLIDQGLELGRAGEALPGEGELLCLGHDVHLQFYMSVGIRQECPDEQVGYKIKLIVGLEYKERGASATTSSCGHAQIRLQGAEMCLNAHSHVNLMSLCLTNGQI